MCFMQIESVLQTKIWSGPAKNRFSVALVVCTYVLVHMRVRTYIHRLDRLVR